MTHVHREYPSVVHCGFLGASTVLVRDWLPEAAQKGTRPGRVDCAPLRVIMER